MIPYRSASLNALRRVARMRSLVDSPVGEIPATLRLTSGSGLFRAAMISSLRSFILRMSSSTWCGRSWSRTTSPRYGIRWFRTIDPYP
jgi:hypothetical protein